MAKILKISFAKHQPKPYIYTKSIFHLVIKIQKCLSYSLFLCLKTTTSLTFTLIPTFFNSSFLVFEEFGLELPSPSNSSIAYSIKQYYSKIKNTVPNDPIFYSMYSLYYKQNEEKKLLN